MIKAKYDNLGDYFIVCESVTDPLVSSGKNGGIEILDHKNENGIKFLRFFTTIQTFKGLRTRNGRMWDPQMVKRATMHDIIQEQLRHGGLPGECDHPCAETGNVSIERIVTILRKNVDHVFKTLEWKDNDTRLCGVTETVADCGGVGDKLMMNILQGIPIAFSNRSVIPQRKNRDGTTDQTGVGRFITADTINMPGCSDAYKDETIPVKNVIKNCANVELAMESCINYILESSPGTQFILDDFNPDLSTARVNNKGDLVVSTESVSQNEKSTLIIPQGIEIRSNIRSFMKSL